jgi:hypothetical protein
VLRGCGLPAPPDPAAPAGGRAGEAAVGAAGMTKASMTNDEGMTNPE